MENKKDGRRNFIFIKEYLNKTAKKESGVTIVLFAVLMTAIMGCAAIVTDIGAAYAEKYKLSNALDAAALAAAQEIVGNADNARQTAVSYIEKNGFKETDVEITISSDTRSVEIRGKSKVDFFFARAFGFTSVDVNATATAAALPITAATGVSPLGVQNFSFVYGNSYVLKDGAGDGVNGNFGPLSLGGTGANTYRNNLQYGYSQKLKVGEWIKTETGNMPHPTVEGLEYLILQCNHTPKCTIIQYNPTCPMNITLPILDTLQVNERGEVQVIGFAKFLLQDVVFDGGHTQISGWFIKHTDVGENDVNGLDRGLYSIRLVK